MLEFCSWKHEFQFWWMQNCFSLWSVVTFKEADNFCSYLSISKLIIEITLAVADKSELVLAISKVENLQVNKTQNAEHFSRSSSDIFDKYCSVNLYNMIKIIFSSLVTQFSRNIGHPCLRLPFTIVVRTHNSKREDSYRSLI